MERSLPPPPVCSPSSPSANSSSISIPCKRARTQKSTKAEAKRPKKDASQSKESDSSNGSGKRSSIYRGVTRPSSLEEDLLLAQTEEAADEKTAEGAEGSAAAPEAEEQAPSDETATTLRDFLARHGEMESEAAAANELQKAFDVLDDLHDGQIDDAFLTVPLKDYNDHLFY